MSDQKCKDQTDLNEIWYSGILGPTDFEFEGRISKLNPIQCESFRTNPKNVS